METLEEGVIVISLIVIALFGYFIISLLSDIKLQNEKIEREIYLNQQHTNSRFKQVNEKLVEVLNDLDSIDKDR